MVSRRDSVFSRCNHRRTLPTDRNPPQQVQLVLLDGLYNGAYHVFASTAKASGYNLVYFIFNDFAKANGSTYHYLDQTPIGTGYRAVPEVFYFARQKL